MKRFCFVFVLPAQAMLFAALLLLSTQAKAQFVDPSEETRVQVPLFKSMVLNLSGPATRVSVGNPWCSTSPGRQRGFPWATRTWPTS